VSTRNESVGYAFRWHQDSALVSSTLHSISDYLVLADADAFIAAWACAVSVADSDAEPLWLMLVGPASASKTETISTLKRSWDERLNQLSRAGLSTQATGKGGNSKPPTGLLHRLGNGCNAFVTIPDLSSLLVRGPSASGSQQGDVYDALRDIFDGYYRRSMGGVAPDWEGRITLLGAVTPEIDTFSAHGDALGPRWVFFRYAQLTQEQARAMALGVVHRDETVTASREAVTEAVYSLITAARARVSSVVLSAETEEIIVDCALVAARGRASIRRERGQVTGAPNWEEPARLVHQLKKLARSLQALEIGDEAVRRIVRRCAVSVVPSVRGSVIEALADLEEDEWISTRHLSNTIHRSLKVSRYAAEDWEAVTVAEVHVGDPSAKTTLSEDEGEDNEEYTRDRRPRYWRIRPDQRLLVDAALS
jgi:hypothetical protein